MKVILKPRQSGKTTKLIKKCAKKGGYIVCHTQKEAHRIFNQANEMGLYIPLPITYDELKSKAYYGKGVRTIYIDNADMLLQYLFNDVRIDTITLTKEKKK